MLFDGQTCLPPFGYELAKNWNKAPAVAAH